MPRTLALWHHSSMDHSRKRKAKGAGRDGIDDDRPMAWLVFDVSSGICDKWAKAKELKDERATWQFVVTR